MVVSASVAAVIGALVAHAPRSRVRSRERSGCWHIVTYAGTYRRAISAAAIELPVRFVEVAMERLALIVVQLLRPPLVALHAAVRRRRRTPARRLTLFAPTTGLLRLSVAPGRS